MSGGRVRHVAEHASDNDASDGEDVQFYGGMEGSGHVGGGHHTSGGEEKKGLWTPEEDQKLLDMYMKEGPQRWPQIANQIPGRNYKQCCERWHNHVNPDIKKGEWTEPEYRMILEAYHNLGNNWTQISKMLPGRTGFAIKSHWKGSLRRKVEGYLKSMGKIDASKECKSYSDFKQVYMDLDLTSEDYDGMVGFLRKNIVASQRRGVKKEAAASAAVTSSTTVGDSDGEGAGGKKVKRDPIVWTKEEDDQLRAGVAANPTLDWLLISINIPGKTVFNCRHRWERFLNPTLKKGHWTAEEDQMLVSLISEMGPKYTEIAEHLVGRTGKQCRNRWLMTLSPTVTKEPFSEDEYRTIIRLKKELGNNWKHICKALPNRTGGAIGNHWHNYMLRKLAFFLKINDLQNYADFEEVFARTTLTDDVLDGMVMALKSGMVAANTRNPRSFVSTLPSGLGGVAHHDSSDSDPLDDLGGGDSDSENEAAAIIAARPKPVKKMRSKEDEAAAAAAAEGLSFPPLPSSGAAKRKNTTVVRTIPAASLDVDDAAGRKRRK